MLYIIHQINKIKDLKKIPQKYGVEVDVRGYGKKLLLNHDPIDRPEDFDELENYLKNYQHAFIVFNVKEAGYEKRIIDLAHKYKIKNYFLLDVEFPYLYRATRKNKFKKIAMRYSEAEPIAGVLAQIKNKKPLLDWVWIDTNTKLPLDKKTVNTLKVFKTCLVCPSRWGRVKDIGVYKKQMQKIDFFPTAIMTSLDNLKYW